jgi:hypothetical protein
MLLEVVYELERQKKVSIIPGAYSFLWDTAVLTAGIQLARNVAIQSDCHFIARYSQIATYDTGPVLSVASRPLTLQFVDTGSGRFLFDDLLPVQLICGGLAASPGNGALPFVFPEPWLIRAGGTAQAQLKNISAATIDSVRLALVGLKVYPLNGTLADLGL